MRCAGLVVCAFVGAALVGPVGLKRSSNSARGQSSSVAKPWGPAGRRSGAALVGRLLVGRDGRLIAYIDGVEVAPDGTLMAVTFDIGTALRMGPRRVVLPVRLIAEEGGRLVASVSAEEANRLPGYMGPSRMSPPFRDGTVAR